LTAGHNSLDDAFKAVWLRLKLVLWCVVALSSGLIPAADVNDWLIIPGKRAGPITPKTTRADLVRYFGAREVEDDYVPGGGDTDPQTGTWVNREHADSSLAIQWNDDKPESHVSFIVFCQSDTGEESAAACRWHTPQGISLGTTLKTLEKLNSGAFKLLGMAWDYGGVVTSWNGGRLESMAAKCGGLSLQLDEPSGQPSDERAQLLEQISEDKEFSSAHAAMQRLNPQVSAMNLSFENCGK
jgi:hypothetical protein